MAGATSLGFLLPLLGLLLIMEAPRAGHSKACSRSATPSSPAPHSRVTMVSHARHAKLRGSPSSKAVRERPPSRRGEHYDEDWEEFSQEDQDGPGEDDKDSIGSIEEEEDDDDQGPSEVIDVIEREMYRKKMVHRVEKEVGDSSGGGHDRDADEDVSEAGNGGESVSFASSGLLDTLERELYGKKSSGGKGNVIGSRDSSRHNAATREDAHQTAGKKSSPTCGQKHPKAARPSGAITAARKKSARSIQIAAPTGENEEVGNRGWMYCREDDSNLIDERTLVSVSVRSSVDSKEDQDALPVHAFSSSLVGSFEDGERDWDVGNKLLFAEADKPGKETFEEAQIGIMRQIREGRRSAPLPLGIGDASYANASKDDRIEPYFAEEKMITQRRPGEEAPGQKVGALQGRSHALIMDEAQNLGQRFASDFAVLNNIPFLRDDDGPAGALLEQQKDDLMNRFLYGGLISGDKSREQLEAMLNLPPASSAALQGLLGQAPHDGGGVGQEGEEQGEAGGNGGYGQQDVANTMALVHSAGGAQQLAAYRRDHESSHYSDEGMEFEAGPMQPELDERETELVMIQREHVTTSSNNASYSKRMVTNAVVPRWALAQYGGGAYAHLLEKKEPMTTKELMRQTDAHGNTVQALMLLSNNQKSLVIPPSEAQLAVIAAKEAAANKEPANITRIREWAQEMSKLDAGEFVELHKPEIKQLAASKFTGASKKIHMIQEAAKRVGMPKGRKSRGRLSMDDQATREAVERGEAVPKNTVIPLKMLRGIRHKLKERYKKAKENAREMGMNITPELVKARDALRYSAGTRNDVIAKGAVYGKTAELMETRKREDRARGKRRRGPEGLMNRPS